MYVWLEKAATPFSFIFRRKLLILKKKIDRKPRSKKIFLSSKEFLMESHFQKKISLFSLICSKKGFEPHRADLERRELRSQRLSSSSSPALIEAWKGWSEKWGKKLKRKRGENCFGTMMNGEGWRDDRKRKRRDKDRKRQSYEETTIERDKDRKRQR